MNIARRTLLNKAVALISEAQGMVAEAASDERDYYDNMPESLQASARGERADEVADALEAAADQLDEVVSNIEDVTTGD